MLESYSGNIGYEDLGLYIQVRFVCMVGAMHLAVKYIYPFNCYHSIRLHNLAVGCAVFYLVVGVSCPSAIGLGWCLSADV